MAQKFVQIHTMISFFHSTLIFLSIVQICLCACPAGSKGLIGRPYCVQLIAKNQTFTAAKATCASLNGKLLMLANENDATRVRNLFRGSGVKLAWLGIVAKPNGHQIFLNGLDATAAHFAPDFMVGNGNLPTNYENAINNCTKKINVINCATWLSRAKCWINPIKALPTAIADYKEYQQFIRYQAYSNPDIAFDPICFKNVKATFFPDPQPVFDLQHPYMGNVMNMPFGSDTGFPDMWLAVPSKQVGVLCQRPLV